MAITEQQLQEILEKTRQEIGRKLQAELEAEGRDRVARIAPHFTALTLQMQSFFPSVQVTIPTVAATPGGDDAANPTRSISNT